MSSTGSNPTARPVCCNSFGLAADCLITAPRGAVIKQSAASPKLLQHAGRAVGFEPVEDMTLRVDDPALDATADDVLVLRNAGPKGAPGMPEAGYLA
ncbi:dihydroxy-acid dehydratase domain-containing protein, partial [Bradyrhizobium elkanii]|uniref:dihydroxy-acid dehydratase domain-containing protein n=1 Tax=Bradyrhizobium elkanii TaxID=29448 RepID=UPI0005C23854